MAKAAILDVLENTIGKYVQNLDAQSLNVAVWAGKIELNSLKLDVEAVNRELARKAAEAPNLALPFRVVSGSFSNLQVDVPWTRITSKPVVMRLGGLNAIVEPYDHLASKYDHSSTSTNAGSVTSSSSNSSSITTPSKKKKKKKEERYIALTYAEEGRQSANTMRRLAELEEVDEEMSEIDKSEQTRSSSKGGFKAKLVRRIIENLQVDIDGVNLEMRGQGCVAGLVLEHFSIVTTDKDGTRTFVDRATNSSNVEKSFIYKVLQLQGFGIYCDEDIKYSNNKRSSLPSVRDERQKGGKNFILSPLSFEAKLRQSDCKKCIDFPKYLLSANLPSVSIQLLRTQLELMNKISRDIMEKKHLSRPLFPEYRPEGPVTSKNAKAWWKYAVRSIGRITRKRSWTEFYIAFQKRKQYISLYKKYFSDECSWISPLTEEEYLILQQIENDKSIGVQGIMNWRNIADAQVELEMKKYEEKEANRNASKSSSRKRFFAFGSSKQDKSLDSSMSSVDDDAPITLSLSEMKELENVALEDAFAENQLSSDSILCDVEFQLGSFKVDLITFASRPLASFQMGTLSSGFKANADGSFVAEFQMSSFNISDRITQNTLFPYVVRSLEQPSDSASVGNFQNALGFKLKKTKNGDQNLVAKLVSFEIVVCSVLIKEFKRFVTFTKDDYSTFTQTPQNPSLEYSITGGADIFYDANDLSSQSIVTCETGDLLNQVTTPNTAKVSDKLSSAFTDAWKSKLEKKIAWKVQLDIHAPIIVLPDSNTDPLATVLVADLGTFRFVYGGGELAAEVQQWFDTNSNDMDITVDRCSLEMDNFTFLIGKAANKDWLKSPSIEKAALGSSEAIIEPITFSIDIGIENGGAQRKCVFGVLPSISLKITYSHIIRIMSVASTWLNFSESLIASNNELLKGVGSDIICEEEEYVQTEAKPSLRVEQYQEENHNEIRDVTVGEMYLSFALQRLSFQITNDQGESIEAHLISVLTSSTQRADGTSSMRIRMGCFWILDHLNSEFPRRQRLVAHSCLPRPASSYAENSCYNILKDLQEQSSFEDNIKNNSLADVTIMKSPHYLNSFAENSTIIEHAKSYPVTKIDAKFSTLFIHWNPYAVRNLLEFKVDVTGFITNLQTETMSSKTDRIEGRDIENIKAVKSLLILNAEMEALEIFLNSAKDDLPLFMMKMCDTKVKYHVSRDTVENVMANVSVGDFRLEVPAKSKILREYSTILGLSSDFSSSLLCLEYGKGPLAVEYCTLDYLDKDKTEMFANVTLSPMRFVHVHSQVFTLIEYVTEGVLGALAQRVASSAAQAAYKMAQTESVGEKIFQIQASGFEFVLPQAAYSTENFALHVGNMAVRYKGFPRPGEGVAVVALDEVTMKSNLDESIIDVPIRMDIDAKMAPLTAPTPDDMATRVVVSISRVQFILTRHHYAQMMKTLDSNISEPDSFLRDEEDAKSTDEQNSVKKTTLANSAQGLTHGGAREVIIKKRMYMTFKFQELALELCNDTNIDSILSINAVQTTVLMRLLPDNGTMQIDATLHDLVVEDTRMVALNRHFRKLVRQVVDSKEILDPDVFKLKYFQSKKNQIIDQSIINIDLGRPQLVFIPDLISDAQGFFKKDDPPTSIHINVDKESLNSFDSIQVLDETNPSTVVHQSSQKTKTIDFKLKTADCRLVLIDMGTTTSNDILSSKWTEAIVLQGQTEAKAKLISNIYTGALLKSNVEVHGERFEIYTAEGEDLVSPVQVLNPIRFSAFMSSNVKNKDLLIDASFVTLSTVNMTFSIQNYALLMAIATSTGEAWSHQNQRRTSDSASGEKSLSKDVIEQIQRVSSELAKGDLETQSQSTGVEMVFRDNISTHPSSSQASQSKVKRRVISVKMTLPEMTLIIVNDLQGLDDALFKFTMQSCVWGGDASLDDTKKDNTIFHVHTNANILADYFDSRTKLWEPLLHKPWELDFKAARGKRKGTTRMTTTLDVESHPCLLSFSEQLIISLRGAASMWSLYSATTKKALDILHEVNNDNLGLSFMQARASYPARAMTTTMPYGIENRTGYTIMFDVKEGEQKARSNATTFFDFPLPQSDGVGGSRSYGQDIIIQKAIDIYIDGECIHFDHLDNQLNLTKEAHKLNGDRFVFSEVIKTGKATIIQITSFMNIINETNLEFSISLKVDDSVEYVGVCSASKSSRNQHTSQSSQTSILGIPTSLLQKAYHSGSDAQNNLALQLSTDNRTVLVGEIQLPPFDAYFKITKGKSSMKTIEVVCSSVVSKTNMEKQERMILKIGCRVTVVDNMPYVDLFVQPRMLLKNNMCINIFAKTMMPQIYKNGSTGDSASREGETIFKLERYESLEIYSPGKLALFAFKCADRPVGDIKTGWNKPGWIEIPLSIKGCLEEKQDCYFPFVEESGEDSAFRGGSTFFISEISYDKDESSNSQQMGSIFSPKMRVVTLNVENLGVDHTGDFLFEHCNTASCPFTLSSFSSNTRRITLLPDDKKLVRILQLSTGRRSLPFCIDEIAFANGGLDSTPILWRDSTESGFYVYKKISFNSEVENDAHNQLEIHIIPGIIIYNGGNHRVRILNAHGQDLILNEGKISTLTQSFGENGIKILIDFVDLGCVTAPLTIAKTGLLVSVVKMSETGSLVGSVAVQTMIGKTDSRYVVKIGPMKHGNVAGIDATNLTTKSFFGNDLLRFRVRWSQMEVTFLDTSKHQDDSEMDTEFEISEISNKFVRKKSASYAKVAHMILNRFTVDFQKVFKDDIVSATMEKRSQARTQFAIIVHAFHLLDCTKVAKGTTVLASISKATNFFDLCIRTRDGANADVVTNVDLLELKLANNGKFADKIIFNTNEAFLWSLLDIASRTKDASKIFGSIDTKLTWDNDTETFTVETIEKPLQQDDETDDDGNYTAPRSDAIYAIKKASVLPTSFLVSFKRQPQTARYQNINVKGAKIMSYFSKKLNFTVNGASLKFSGFKVHNVKGPPDRMIELIISFYSSQMKSKIFTLLTATCIDEWHQLAGRDEGDKGYIEGDLLRTAGNLTGKSAGYLVKKVGQGIGFGFTAGTAEVGNGIQHMTEAIGIGAVGAGANSVISGLGDGVGSTVQGVGDAGSKIIKGTGKGVGQIIGGVGGGIILAGKGVGKGVMHGDGQAVLTGLGDGVVSVGNGLLKGGESVATGVGDGVFAVGKGLFSGVKSIGMGLGDAVTGKKSNKRPQRRRRT